MKYVVSNPMSENVHEKNRLLAMFKYGIKTFKNSPDGMMTQAIPATNRFPIVQNAAMKLSMDPRLDLG